MRVVIANPPWPGGGYGIRSNSRWPHKFGHKALPFPLYLAYASAVLKKEGFDTYPIDAVEREIGIYKFVEELKEINPKIVFLEISAPSLNYDLETSALIKQKIPTALLVLCGTHVAYAHAFLIENYSFIDACIRGEFEYAMRDICRAVSKRKSLKGILGVTYREKGKTVVNPARPYIDNIDELPFPDRGSFNIMNYVRKGYSGKRPAMMIATRGCPFQCSFCVWTQLMYGHKYRQRSAKSVVDEMELLIKKQGVDEIDFDDDTFALSKNYIRAVCNEIINRNIKIRWRCNGRVNSVDYEMAKLMKDAGCTIIFYGFESSSEKILKSINKHATKQQMIDAVRATQKAGIVAAGSFILGLPDENNETIRQTIKFAKQLRSDWLQFVLAAPYPGTEFYSQVEKEGLLEIDSIADLDGSRGPIIRTRHLTKKQLEGWQRKAYISYYSSPRIILTNLKKMTSIYDLRRIARGARAVFDRIVFFKK